MPITAEHVGRTYPATEPYPIERVKIAEFATALGDQALTYRGPAAVAPPTFAFVLAGRAWECLFADAELELALERVLHADQKFTWHRPLRVGDVLTAQLSIDKVRSRVAADLIGTTVTLRDDGGTAVATCSATLLHAHGSDQ